MSHRLQSVADKWPVGTSVGAYLVDARNNRVGSAVESAPVQPNGSLSFLTLEAETRYQAFASNVGVFFTTGEETTVAGPTWGPFGEPGVGGRMTAFAISPHDPLRVIVDGDMLGPGLSEDGGKSWLTTTGLPSWEMAAVTFHPTDGEVVWVGSMSGPMKSEDGGHTWTRKGSGMPTDPDGYPYTRPVERILIDPADTDHMLAFMGSNRSWKTSTADVLNYGRVYETLDAGESWTLKGTLGANLNITAAVRASAGDLSVLYASTSTAGVWKSTDGGGTWTAVNTGLTGTSAARTRQLASNPATGVVWVSLNPGAAAETGGIFRTDDAGANWTQKVTGLGQNTAAAYSHIHRASDGTLYTSDTGIWGSGQRIYKSVDNGDNWTNISPTMERFYPAGIAPYWISSAPSSPGRVIAGTSDVMLMSEDAGVTWRDVGAYRRPSGRWRGTGYSGLLGSRVAFSPFRKGLVFLNAFDAGHFLRSEDDGQSWHRPSASFDNFNGGYDTAIGGVLGEVVVSILGQTTFNGIVVSTDYGATVSGKAGAGVGLPTKGTVGARSYGSVAFGSKDGSVIYAVLPSGDLYKSTDTGANWTLLKSDVEAYCVAVSADFATVYLGTTTGTFVGDGSSSGSFTLSGTFPRATRLVFDSEGDLYACAHKAGGTVGGLWRLRGGVWTQLFSSPYVKDVAIDPRDPSRIVFVTQDDPFNDTNFATGIYLSTDGGNSEFESINDGLPMLRVRSVAFDPWTAGRVVVGTDGRGFWTANLDDAAVDDGQLERRVEAGSLIVPVAVTVSRSITAADVDCALELAVDVDITVPPDTELNVPVGTVVEIHARGTGSSVVEGVGVTIDAIGDLLNLSGQYASASLRKRAANNWVLAGSLA